MTRSFLLLAGLVIMTAPAAQAQIGLASSVQTLALTATKQGQVGVALSGADAQRLGVPAVSTRWNLDPAQTGSVALVAYAGRTPAEGAVFTQPISTANARGNREDQVRVSADPTGSLTLRVITQ